MLAVKYGVNHLGLQVGSKSMVLRVPLKKRNSSKDGSEQPYGAQVRVVGGLIAMTMVLCKCCV